MDCEKFESTALDELYGELDEPTSAAVARHAASCTRCCALLAELRATRRLAEVPAVEPPSGRNERAMHAVEDPPRTLPFGRRMARSISIAGDWAMRPQSAMAAVFMVMLGTSLLLLRGRSSRAPASAEIRVTEQGTPAPAGSLAGSNANAPLEGHAPAAAAPPRRGVIVAEPPADESRRRVAAGPAQGSRGEDVVGTAGAPRAFPPAASPAEAEVVPSPLDSALALYQAARYEAALRAFEPLSAADPNADLWAARSLRDARGCRAAVGRFDRVAQRAAGTAPGWDALLEGALCYRSMGDFATARARLSNLLSVDSHKDRAHAELDRLKE
jgi:TolA-binding protein